MEIKKALKILNIVQSSERKIKGDKTKFFKGDITL